MGICNDVPGYVSLCGLEYQIGVSTDDFAQENLCATPGRSLCFRGMGLPESESMGQFVGECVCSGVCLGAGVMHICCDVCPSMCWDLNLSVHLCWCLHTCSCPDMVWVSVWRGWAHSTHLAHSMPTTPFTGALFPIVHQRLKTQGLKAFEGSAEKCQ